ncbi:MAG: hypothetical protein WAT39_26130 [Planctomycetota bacterium]
MIRLDALCADFQDMVLALCEAGAEFLIVGGYAVAWHGHPRSTGDIDLLVRPSAANAERVWQALVRFGAPVTAAGLTVNDLTRKETVYQIGRPPRRIDILTDISGVDFDAAWQRRVESEWRGHKVGMLGLDDLLTNKRASARAKDLADVRELENLRRARHGRRGDQH